MDKTNINSHFGFKNAVEFDGFRRTANNFPPSVNWNRLKLPMHKESNYSSENEDFFQENEDPYERRLQSVGNKERGYPMNYSEEDANFAETNAPKGFLHTPTHIQFYRQYKMEKAYANKRAAAALAKRKSACKFCATGSSNCPCPLHLPAVPSRYLKAFEDSTRNSVTINVFKNGDDRATPTMIHFLKVQMHSMEHIMRIIDRYVRFPIGYAYALYNLWGELIEDPSHLEPYETYVVVNSCKRQFIPKKYGSKKPSTVSTRRRRQRSQASFTFSFSPYNNL